MATNDLSSISNEIYTNKARFLMEVIQNADDNPYHDNVQPTISIIVSPRFVKIECNETGFTEENVRALCRTGRSSKEGTGYIGEKGIGFKSVFKIANRAHVRSPPYYFELDQHRELGMITPQWDTAFFARHPQKQQTTIILDRISDEYEDENFASALENDLELLDPTVLLFLRKIDRLHLTLTHFTSLQALPAVSKRYLRHKEDKLCEGIMSLCNENLNLKTYFYKFEKLTSFKKFKGRERRRPGMSETNIVLAFPVEHDSGIWKPDPKDLQTFAYLPLGYFNFWVSRFLRTLMWLLICHSSSFRQIS
jgi:hypothetical protein